MLFSVFTSFRNSGSGTAYLTCKSESGKTIFNAELQDIDGLLQKAELIVDGKKVTFDENDEARTIFDEKNGVFTLYLSGSRNKDFPNGRFVRLWAMPKTFKILKSDTQAQDQKYEFKAKIEGTEPRKGADRILRIPQVELTCILEYKI